MRKIKTFSFSVLFFIALSVFCFYSSAEDAVKPEAPVPEEAQAAVQENTAQVPASEVAPTQGIVKDGESAPGNITLEFKDADIQNVLKIISYKSGINIVSTPDVIGNVSIRLVDVPWERALDILLKTYGFGMQRTGNVILVTKLENISKIQAEEALQTEIFILKFLDAQDAEKIIISLLSPRGKISVLYTRGQKGWKFGTFQIGKQESKVRGAEREEEKAINETISIERGPAGELISRKAEFQPSIKSKTIIITDTASSLDRVRNLILPQIDKKPKQVLIEARIMEVNRDRLRDLGVDWGTGSAGATTYTTAPGDLKLDAAATKTIAARNLASEFTPSIFSPLEGTTKFPGTYPYAAGLEIIWKHLTGAQFEVILHALEEDVNTNTLSAPRILTLDNQEASILVGFHTPILSSTVTAGTDTTGPTQTQTLDYYQEIGIRLNVVPQVSDEGYINMIIHPSVTSTTSSVTATNVAGSGTTRSTSTVDYPVINVREAQTQLLMKDGETVVLGGLLKDVVSKQVTGIPFLRKIPKIGKLFERETTDTAKVDLLIFLTARIVKETDFSPEEINRLENRMDRGKAFSKTLENLEVRVEKPEAVKEEDKVKAKE